MQTRPNLPDELRYRVETTPFTLTSAVAGMVLGMAGVLVGEQVSRGMTILLTAGHARTYAHIWGVELLLAGVLVLVSVFGGLPSLEASGMWMLAAGYAFYAITVVGGLRMGGYAAGTLATSLTIGCTLRAIGIGRRAHRNALREGA